MCVVCVCVHARVKECIYSLTRKKRDSQGNVIGNGLKKKTNIASENNHLDTKMKAYINSVLTHVYEIF